MNAHHTIYTIGHSNRTAAFFIEMLRSFGISTLADVRSMPGSKWVPKFNSKALAAVLEQNEIKYRHYPSLGGRIPRNATPPKDTTKPFSAYQNYMETDAFRKEIDVLHTLAKTETVAYMCAEANWWQCHRAKISDYLTLQGWEVIHITDVGKSVLHIIEEDESKSVQGSLF
ncbi:MAG: DUF488 domain-containing protein [Flavipsychrobacter sp.]|nr:DUF488 domain-containing protein [Flavipsychrobacter sp.]